MSTIYQYQTLQRLTMSGADSYYRRPVLMCEDLRQFKPWVDCRQNDVKASDKLGEKKKYLAHYVYVTSKIWSQVIFYLTFVNMKFLCLVFLIIHEKIKDKKWPKIKFNL